jgi:hypothetical protein
MAKHPVIVGFWLLLFVLMWGVCGVYLSRPQP